jgi:hypothetical protein
VKLYDKQRTKKSGITSAISIGFTIFIIAAVIPLGAIYTTGINSSGLPQAFAQGLEEGQQQQTQEQQQTLRPSPETTPLSSPVPPASVSSSINVLSIVPGVTITAINIADSNNQILIGLKYSGSDSTANTTSGMSSSSTTTTTTTTTASQTPGVVLLASAVNLTLEQITSLGAVFLQATPENINNDNVTSDLMEQVDSIIGPLTNMTGTEELNAGWDSPQTVPITLQGNTTLDETNFINVQVLPLIQ